ADFVNQLNPLKLFQAATGTGGFTSFIADKVFENQADPEGAQGITNLEKRLAMRKRLRGEREDKEVTEQEIKEASDATAAKPASAPHFRGLHHEAATHLVRLANSDFKSGRRNPMEPQLVGHFQTTIAIQRHIEAMLRSGLSRVSSGGGGAVPM